jgi:phospholipase DDHD1
MSTPSVFRIENFFCLGSPLSVFLSLRWRDPTNTEFHEHILPRNLSKLSRRSF